MRILITGAKGQLGRALVQALPNHDLYPVGAQEMDITQPPSVARVFGEFKPDVVVHAAAWTDTAGCEADPERAMRVNQDGTRHVAEACATCDAAMLYVSTNEVFDGAKSEPYRESDPTAPLNAYARSKLAGERAVQEILEHYWIVRTSWLYGPGRVSFPEKILQAARSQGRLRLVTDEVASPTRTIDLAQAISQLISHPVQGIFHLTNAGYCSRLEWAKEVLRLAGMEDLPVEAATQAEFGGPVRKPAFSALANMRAASLGIELRPWQEALYDHFQPVHA